MRVLVVASSCLITCAGCSSLPALPEEQFLPVEAVVKAVQCEMQDAVKEATVNGRHKWLLGWEAAYVFTINVTETGYVKAASNTFPIPISPGLLTLGVGGGLTRTSKRVAKLSFTPKVSEIKYYECGDMRPMAGHPFISSKIGFSEWLKRALDGADPSEPQSQFVPKAEKPINVGHTFDFTIDANASISPTFLVAPGAATLTPSGSYDRADDDILDVTFAAPKEDTTKTSGKTLAPKTVFVQLTEAHAKDIVKADNEVAETTRSIAGDERKLQELKVNASPAFTEGEHKEGKVRDGQGKDDKVIQSLTDRIEAAKVRRVEAEAKAKYLRSLPGPRIALKEVPIRSTTVSSAANNISAQEALQQLQFERLLSGPRTP